jgi:hypothetical protein
MQHIKERIKKEGAEWVRKQNFWLFGTATFKDGSQVTAEQAVADAKHFFNILDRSILKRKELAEGNRLERIVFLEYGRLGANTHIHFFIKGKELRDYREIYFLSNTIWQKRIVKAHNLVIKDNLGVDDTRSEYCWKELTTQHSDVLLTECCYLNKH